MAGVARAMSTRRLAVTAGCVGAAAGCLGTWFEMSHAVICVPVVTLPPLQLSHHVAIGSTVFGVAARQIIAATLYALDPSNDNTVDELAEIIDLKTAAILSASATVTALSSAAFSVRIGSRVLRKTNGVFLVALALFLYWRDMKVKAMEEDREKALAEAANLPAPETPAVEEQPGPSILRNPFASLTLPEEPFGTGDFRLIFLGSVSGVILGLFGIGPAWMLAPVLTHTGSKEQQGAVHAPRSHMLRDEVGPAPADFELAEIGLSASDHRTRLTSCFAMVPPSIAAAWRHYTLGNIQNGGTVALPLAAGAVAGSAIAGMTLVDVPCEEEMRYWVQMALFAHGCWSFFKA